MDIIIFNIESFYITSQNSFFLLTFRHPVTLNVILYNYFYDDQLMTHRKVLFNTSNIQISCEYLSADRTITLKSLNVDYRKCQLSKYKNVSTFISK